MRLLRTVYIAAALTLAPSMLAGADEGQRAQPDQAGPDASDRALEAFIAARRLRSVLGIQVRTKTEETMGRIVDLLADRDGNVVAAVIEFGGFLGIGTRRIAIDWASLKIESKDKSPVAVLDATRDELRLAPEYKPGQPVVIFKVDQPTPPTTDPGSATRTD
jgi:hypothetical protein